jgi:hypothetical protein
MRGFIAVGFAIVAALAIIGVRAKYCEACCNGQPCNPELRAAKIDAARAQIKQEFKPKLD